MLRLGAHTSVAGGFDKSIERGLKVGSQTIQIFTKSNNQWAAPPIAPGQIAHFRKAQEKSGIGPIFAHTAYLINVGSPEKELHERSKEALQVEVERATQLGLSFVVLHPGSHKETDEESCIQRIAKAVSSVIEKTRGSHVKVLYETAAGQGSAVGYCFEHLRDLLHLTGHPERTGICIDTCHLFVSGYDIRTRAAYEKTISDFDKIVGIKRVEAFHLNDSLKPLGAKVDRHEHIGRGHIGLEGFRSLLNDKRFHGVPMVLETPKDEETLAEDVMNLKTLRGLLKK